MGGTAIYGNSGKGQWEGYLHIGQLWRGGRGAVKKMFITEGNPKISAS
jgi:hypothetical protein